MSFLYFITDDSPTSSSVTFCFSSSHPTDLRFLCTNGLSRRIQERLGLQYFRDVSQDPIQKSLQIFPQLLHHLLSPCAFWTLKFILANPDIFCGGTTRVVVSRSHFPNDVNKIAHSADLSQISYSGRTWRCIVHLSSCRWTSWFGTTM